MGCKLGDSEGKSDGELDTDGIEEIVGMSDGTADSDGINDLVGSEDTVGVFDGAMETVALFDGELDSDGTDDSVGLFVGKSLGKFIGVCPDEFCAKNTDGPNERTSEGALDGEGLGWVVGIKVGNALTADGT